VQSERHGVRRCKEEVEVVVINRCDQVHLLPPRAGIPRHGPMNEAERGLTHKRWSQNRNVGSIFWRVDDELVPPSPRGLEKLAAQLGQVATHTSPLAQQLPSVDAYSHGVSLRGGSPGRPEGGGRRTPDLTPLPPSGGSFVGQDPRNRVGEVGRVYQVRDESSIARQLGVHPFAGAGAFRERWTIVNKDTHKPQAMVAQRCWVSCAPARHSRSCKSLKVNTLTVSPAPVYG